MMIPNLILNVLSIKLIVSIRIGVIADILLMACTVLLPRHLLFYLSLLLNVLFLVVYTRSKDNTHMYSLEAIYVSRP